MKLKPPAGGGKSLIFFTESFINWFVRTADSFRNDASDCLYEWVIMNHWLSRFVQRRTFIHEWNTAVFALEMRSATAVTLFGTIFVDDIE